MRVTGRLRGLLILLLAALAGVVLWFWDLIPLYPTHATHACGSGYHPSDVAFAPDGRLYSTDLLQGRLLEHNTDGCSRIEPDLGSFAHSGIALSVSDLICIANALPDRANVELTGSASRKAVHQASHGALLRIEGDEIAVLAGDLAYPSGVLLAESVLFVADYATGELHSYDLLGKRISTYGGLEGPMGLARARNGDICVAEADAGRVTCLNLYS